MDDADSKLQRLILTAWDLIKTVNSELDLLAQDRRVVDAIYAVNDVRHRAADHRIDSYPPQPIIGFHLATIWRPKLLFGDRKALNDTTRRKLKFAHFTARL